MRAKGGLNAKERKVYELIRNSKNPITSSELMQLTGFNKNAVQPCLRTLLEMKLIEVKDTVVEGNIVSRRFVTTKESDSIISGIFYEEFKSFSKMAGKKELFSALFKADEDPKLMEEELGELSKMLEAYKKK